MQGCYHQLTKASNSPRFDVWNIFLHQGERGGPRANKALDGNKATLPCRPPLSFHHPFVPSSIAPSLYPDLLSLPGRSLFSSLLTQPPSIPLPNPGDAGSPGLPHPAVETRGPGLGPWGSRLPVRESGVEPRSPSHDISGWTPQSPPHQSHCPGPLPPALPANLGSAFRDDCHAPTRGSGGPDLRTAGLAPTTCLFAPSTTAYPI